MSLPVVQIVFFDCTQTYRDDPVGVMSGLMEFLKNSAGQISTYHGPQVEDNTKAYLVILWQTYEHHKAIMESESYKDLLSTLVPALSAEARNRMKMIHINFQEDPSKSFEGPFTEFAVWTLNDLSKQEEMKRYNTYFTRFRPDGLISTTWGHAMEDHSFYVLIAGWESVEAHHAARHGVTEEMKATSMLLRNIATKQSVTHAKLIKST